jgi:hypothetical protein
MMKKTLFLLFFLILSSFINAQETLFLEGKIFDKDTKDPLPAYVLVESGRGCSADGLGRFKLAVNHPPAGTVKLTVFLIGYKKKNVEAKIGEFLSIGLELESIAAHEITVTADSVVSDVKNQKTVTLNKMDVYRIPGAAADPVYASHILPGVNSPPDASSLLIRGGAPDEVGFFFDGIEILHPFLSESLHESYFSIFDNQVIENFSVATSGFHPKYGDALSGVMDISAKDLVAKSEGGLGLSVLGLNSYVGFPLKNLGSFVGSYDRGYSDLLTELNNRGGERDFRTEHAFGKFIVRLNKSNQIRVYGLYDGYRYSQDEEFSIGSKNMLAAVSWTAFWSKNVVTKALFSALGYDMTFDQPGSLRVDSRDDAAQFRLDAMWDLDRHFLEWGTDIQVRNIATQLFDMDAQNYKTRGTRFGLYANDKFRVTDQIFMNAGIRISSLNLLDRGPTVDPRLSAAFLLTRRDIVRFSTGIYHQYGDYFVLKRNPTLRPKSAIHYALSYDRIEDDLELRATAYDKEYKNLYLEGVDGIAGNEGSGFARGAEFFVKKKSRRYEAIFVYNFLRSKRKENDVPSLAPSPYEIVHSATAVLTWKFNKTSVGLRYSVASGRPYTPLASREWDPENQVYLPLWGTPYSARYPIYQRLDLTGSTNFTILNRLVVLYFGITNVLNNANILRYDYGDDYAGRKDQQSIFGRSLFVGMYIPFF